jgi:hypothetical protein
MIVSVNTVDNRYSCMTYTPWLITTHTCALGQADSDRPFTSKGQFQSQSDRMGRVRDKVAVGQIHLRRLWFPLSELFTGASCSFIHLPPKIYNISTCRRHSINVFFFVDKKNQLDVTFCIIYFCSISCSTCFGQPCAHHQELTTAWCYRLVLVCAVAAGRFLPTGLDNLPAATAHTNTRW